MRNLLITNDDGIKSDGIIRLAMAAKKFGKVYVIAPEAECSAMSHRITLRKPIDVYKADFPVDGVEAYATTGTPADCVRFGMLNIVKGKTDVVLSGINYGFNSGSDIQYSATVGAALEAASSGIHAIALSEGFETVHEVTDAYLEQILDDLIDEKLDFNQVWNVNFPGCKLSEYKGIKEHCQVAKNAFYDDSYREEILPDGTLRLWIEGKYHENAAPDTDFRAIVDGYISIGIVNNLS